jgi:hypothetical protein
MKNPKRQRTKSQKSAALVSVGISLGFGVLGFEHLPAGLLAFGIFNP